MPLFKHKDGDEILYEVKERTAIITLNLPNAYNALTGAEYRRLEQLLQVAAEDPNVFVTIIQATGKYFSAGANFKKDDLARDDGEDQLAITVLNNSKDPEEFKKQYERTIWSYKFGSRNFSITSTFQDHPNILVVALNGPVIGLSAALIAHADFIYATDNTFLLTPFANIGLVTEGGASYTLLKRLGQSKAAEALIMSKPIPASDLYRLGFLNELYPQSKFKSVEDFNKHVQELIKFRLYDLDQNSALKIKKLMKLSMQDGLAIANHQEIIGGTDRFALGVPQKKFAALGKKSHSHKL